jgi:hypothetical protein
MLLIAATVLLMALSTTVVFAGSASPPNYGTVDPVGIWPPPPMPPLSALTGVEKVFPSSPAPGGQIHIITDLLIPVGNVTPVNGWVTFWCQSQIGFQYNIGATGLEHNAAYAVTAEGLRLTLDPSGPIKTDIGNFSIVSTVALDLGILHTDVNGLGSANGVKKLEPVVPDLYVLMVYIRNTSDQIVLQSDPADPQDLEVY